MCRVRNSVFQSEWKHKCMTVSGRRWHGIVQWDGFCYSSASNQKLEILLCLLNFRFLTSSHSDWNWQNNYLFFPNGSQSMWAGSKHRDMWRERKREREKVENSEGRKRQRFVEFLAMFQSSGRHIAEGWRREEDREGRKEGGREGKALGGETSGDCVAGVPLMSPDRNQIGSRAASKLWLCIRLAPPGFSWPGQARFWLVVGHSWSRPMV